MTPNELRNSGYGPLPECGDTTESDFKTWVVILLCCAPWLVPLILWAVNSRT